MNCIFPICFHMQPKNVREPLYVSKISFLDPSPAPPNQAGLYYMSVFLCKSLNSRLISRHSTLSDILILSVLNAQKAKDQVFQSSLFLLIKRSVCIISRGISLQNATAHIITYFLWHIRESSLFRSLLRLSQTSSICWDTVFLPCYIQTLNEE